MKKLIIIISIIITIIAFIFVYRFYNNLDQTALTVLEKKYLQDHKANSIDFLVINDYPLYGINGEGVFFSFLDNFEKENKIEFNKISYLKDEEAKEGVYQFKILNNDEELTDKDLLFFEDNYVAVSNKYERLNHIKDMKNIVFGIFTNDQENISYYLKSGSNISFKTYDNINDLLKALNNQEVGMIIIPNIMYLDKTINNNKYFINYHFTEMKKKIVIRCGSVNELNSIIKKYYTKWQSNNYVKEYNKSYLKYYLDNKNITDKEKTDLLSKTYTYGYVNNPPYEVYTNNKLTGIAGEYLERLSRLSNVKFKYKKYKNKAELKRAADNNDIDIYFDYFNYQANNYLPTISTFVEDYVILGKEEDNYIINSYEAIRNNNICMIKDDSLYNYINNNTKASIKTYNNIDDIIKKCNNELLVIDSEIYSYYQNNKLNNYKLLYKDTMINDYQFMIKEDNKIFYDLFNYIINTNSYYNFRNSGIEAMHANILENSTMTEVYTLVLAIIFIPLIIIGIIYLFIKNKRKIKKIKITDRHKYTDMLTSLKNRNYLNAKLPEWEQSNILPQAVVVIDLNNVKYINDNYGHEEGDNLIIKASSILVNTQLENSEIIRTDGNEFLVYLIGYSEKQVDTYAKKLSKELKGLPHEFGAALGYSMILDNIKTIDDAINEATLEMITNKEDYK